MRMTAMGKGTSLQDQLRTRYTLAQIVTCPEESQQGDQHETAWRPQEGSLRVKQGQADEQQDGWP